MSTPRPLREVAAAVFDGSRCLVVRGAPEASVAEVWGLPGGKWTEGTAPDGALVRVLEKELGLEGRVEGWLAKSDTCSAGQRVVREVFAVGVDMGARPCGPRPLRWIGSEELGTLDWARADVPALPAVWARMRARPEAQRCAGRVAILSADWGKEPRKRAVYRADASAGWRVARETPPAGGWTLGALTLRARRLRDALGVPVLVGIDAVLGVPAAFARAAGTAGFLETLRWLAASGGLHEESGAGAAWRAERPFFRVQPGRGGLSDTVEAAGGQSVVRRQMDLRTQGNPVFVLSGIPGTVGSGSRALWSELAAQLDTEERPRLWPFDGSLAELTAAGDVLLAETYPRAAYAVALDAQLPAAPRSLAKTRRPAREQALHALVRAGWIRKWDVALHDLAAAARSEDDFDALLTAAALVRLVAEEGPLAHELVDPLAEGGILGTAGLRLPEVGRSR